MTRLRAWLKRWWVEIVLIAAMGAAVFLIVSMRDARHEQRIAGLEARVTQVETESDAQTELLGAAFEQVERLLELVRPVVEGESG